LTVSVLVPNINNAVAARMLQAGDAGRAVFWYKPEGSKAYEVLYGDLSVG